MNAIDELLNSIFDLNKPPFYTEFDGWVRGSRRYKAFVTTYSTKIRTKLKNAGDESGIQDLRAELETAALLLREDRFTLEYEKYAALKQRGPDFTVTFKTHTPFNIEVRRIRYVEMDTDDSDARTIKLMAVLIDKVGQMPPSIVNLLWLNAERQITEDDLARAVAVLLQLAEHKNEDFFTRRGFKNASDFLRQYRQLSGIVVHHKNENIVWLNPLAKHKPLPELVTAMQRLVKN
ncbi:MAG: hypothetical protein GC179_12740 [Anaerolineaceae bacterium]|nr:hypothetical protein [Anaerolineaceae bacterium]